MPECRYTINTVGNQHWQGCKPLSGGFNAQLIEQVQFIEHFWLLWTLRAIPVNQLTFREQLEKHGNEADVRDRMARGLYTGQHLGVAQEWLRQREEARSIASSAARDAREAETLAIAKEALEVSRQALLASEVATARQRLANIIAAIAIAFSTITAIAAIVIQFIQRP